MKISITENNNYNTGNKPVNSGQIYVKEVAKEVKNYFYGLRHLMLWLDVVAEHLQPRMLVTERIEEIKTAVIKFPCLTH